jgi:DNA ligase-1
MNTLEQFKRFYNEITQNNSRKYKQEILRKYKDDEVIKKYLRIAFNPYVVYGISTKKLNTEVRSIASYIPKTSTVFELFDYLAEHNTGTFAEILECQNALNAVAAWDRDCSNLLASLICKDISIGCDAKTINKEIPDLIPTFNVQLANKYFDKPEYVEGKTFALTTKIDGGRIIALKENGKVSFYTRAGQKYEGLVDLEQEMAEKLPDGLCLDGEITLLENEGVPSKEAYKQAMKITRSDGEKHGLKMIVFDAMLAEEFRNQRCDRVWEERRRALDMIFGPRDLKYFELLPVLYQGEDTEMILKWLDAAIAADQEGIMINIALAPYEFKRTNYLLKVKKMSTLDLEIVGFEEGTGRLAGTLGAILVRYKNGNIVKVGSGFSDRLRIEIWASRDEWLGNICEIQYFEETTNADGGESLRFPVFKDYRPDKTEADY